MAAKKTGNNKPKSNTRKKKKKTKQQLPLRKDKQVLTWGAIALVITFLCYLPAINNGFVNWDDPDYVEDNVLIHQINGENITAIFTEPIAENYHPLTFISLMIDYAIGKGDPMPFHITNILIHLLATAAVFVFVLLLFQRNLLVAFIAALIFGIHPMHVESVAWITERKDVLYGLFFMLGLITYARYNETGKQKYYAYTIGWYVLSLLSKPAAVTFFLIQFLMDYWYKRPWNRKVILEKLPFIALALLFTILTIQIQSDTAVKDFEEISFINRIFAAAYGFNTYVLKFLVPYKLHTFYPYPPLNNPPTYFYVMPLFSLIIVGASYWFFRKNRAVLFGLLFFLLTISITLQLFSFGGAILSERYTYIPYIGLGICMGLLLDHLIKRNQQKKQLILGGAMVYGLLLSILCFQQTKVWKDGISLWGKVIEDMAFPTAIPYTNRAFIYKKQGRLQEALVDFEAALKLDSKDKSSLLGKGNIEFANGNHQSALQWYDQLLAIDPNHVEGLSSRAACLGVLNRNEEALRDLDKALTLDPRFMDGLRNKGVLLMNTKRFEEAIAVFNEFLRYVPNDTMMLNTIGVCYQNLNNHAAALNYFNSCVNLEPQNGMWLNNRGISHRALGQTDQARTDFQRAKALGFNVNPILLNQ